MEVRRIGWRDAWLPVVLVGLGTAELASLGTRGWDTAVGLQVLAGMLLVVRRRHPLVVGPLASAILLLTPWLGPSLDQVATPILFLTVAIFSLARWVADLRGLAGLAVILVLMFLDYVLVDDRQHNWTDVVFVLSLTVPPYVLGRIVRRLDDQRRLLARQQALIRDQAAAEERERIARELHDVLAHSVSAMVVQTAAAQDLLATSPEHARALLESVADTGRAALAETGQLLQLIREDPESPPRPAPGLRDVADLVARVRGQGLALEAEIDLPDRRLAGPVDGSAYRVVQELLTNAVRYAEGPVQLVVRTGPERLRISCANSVGRGRAAAGAGLGLRGMAERVSLLGGTLHRREDGGRFAVEVDIPLGGRAVP